MRFAEIVTVLRAPLVAGPYNSTGRDWPNATRTDVAAEVQPLSSSEDVVGQERTVTRWRMFTYPTTDLVATDRIEWDDGSAVDTYEVDGDVERHRTRGGTHHIEVVLLKVEGG